MKNYWLIGLMVFIMYKAADKITTPRGIANNNPGNIRLSGDNWRGLAEKQKDSDFFQFSDPVYGIRAMVRVLRNYQAKYNLNTIEEIISRWAPSNENNTAAYVQSVSRKVGISPGAEISVDAIMPNLLQAIIYHENGQQPYTAEQIQTAINIA